MRTTLSKPMIKERDVTSRVWLVSMRQKSHFGVIMEAKRESQMTKSKSQKINIFCNNEGEEMRKATLQYRNTLFSHTKFGKFSQDQVKLNACLRVPSCAYE